MARSEVDVDSNGDRDPDAVKAGAPTGRHRLHSSPPRGHAMKVLYGDDEWLLVVEAARAAGLRPSSYVATVALAQARRTLQPDDPDDPRHSRPAVDEELLTELVQARLALGRYGVNVNQAVAALHSTGRVPSWLEQAVAGAQRSVERVDETAALITQRLERGRRQRG